jgi:hypothetical protein
VPRGREVAFEEAFQGRRNFTTYLKEPRFWGDVSHESEDEDVTSGGDIAALDAKRIAN